MFLRCACIFSLTFLLLASARCEHAVAAEAESAPALLKADEVAYDQETSTAKARGHVEVVQGDRILLADEVTYNQATDTVHATGNVSILESSGDVYFSNDATLQSKMSKGVVQQFRARFKDNALFAAREGVRVNEDVIKLKNAVYSPCHICEPSPGEDPNDPLWQVRARGVRIDEEEQRVAYRDAFLDIYGVPVGYTPYFSHPTPDAPSQSGILVPQFFHASDLGYVVKQPVYISLAPNMDMTLTPWYISEQSPLLEGEFRHLIKEGYYEIKGAITRPHDRDAAGNEIDKYDTRGYIDAKGKFTLDPYWSAGFES